MLPDPSPPEEHLFELFKTDGNAETSGTGANGADVDSSSETRSTTTSNRSLCRGGVWYKISGATRMRNTTTLLIDAMTGGFSALPVDDAGARWSGVARVVGPAWSQLPSLTVGMLGVSTLWSLEISYASPYLISLGLSKSLLAMVFLAGPLSGLIVQPVIGILADNSKSRFGRRRPLILISTLLSALAIILLGFTRSFASLFTTLGSHSNDVLTVSLAVFSIYLVDFCINAVQALDRALLVDTLPIDKQPAGNAWAARMGTVGHVFAYFIGNLDLPLLFPFFGNTQIKVFSVFTTLFLVSTQAWTCFHVKERVLLASSTRPKGLSQELSELWHTLVTLPRIIRRICWIQFFAWLGWFPVLLYTTVYIGDLHKRTSPAPENQDAVIALDAESTRLGTRALFFSALVSLAGNIFIPFFVARQHASSPLQPKRKTWLERVQIDLASLWAFSHFLFAVCMATTFVISTVSGATFIIAVTGFCWAIAHWAPFALLGEAILSHQTSDDMGSIHLADTRLTRVVHPRDDVEYLTEDEETQKLFQADTDDEELDALNGHSHQYAPSGADILGPPVSRLSSLDQDDQLDPPPRIGGLGNARARISRIDISIPSSPPSVAYLEEDAMTSMPGPARKSTNGLSDKAGAILGIHILFIVIPQFIMTGLASMVFAVFDPDKSVVHGHQPDATVPGNGTLVPASQDTARQLFSRSDEFSQATPNSVAIIFRLGGITAVIAGILAYRLAQDLKRRGFTENRQ